jgi:hypothetical protein
VLAHVRSGRRYTTAVGAVQLPSHRTSFHTQPVPPQSHDRLRRRATGESRETPDAQRLRSHPTEPHETPFRWRAGCSPRAVGSVGPVSGDGSRRCSWSPGGPLDEQPRGRRRPSPPESHVRIGDTGRNAPTSPPGGMSVTSSYSLSTAMLSPTRWCLATVMGPTGGRASRPQGACYGVSYRALGEVMAEFPRPLPPPACRSSTAR